MAVSTNLQLGCSCKQRWIDYTLNVSIKGQRLTSQEDQIWSNDKQLIESSRQLKGYSAHTSGEVGTLCSFAKCLLRGGNMPTNFYWNQFIFARQRATEMLTCFFMETWCSLLIYLLIITVFEQQWFFCCFFGTWSKWINTTRAVSTDSLRPSGPPVNLDKPDKN